MLSLCDQTFPIFQIIITSPLDSMPNWLYSNSNKTTKADCYVPPRTQPDDYHHYHDLDDYRRGFCA